GPSPGGPVVGAARGDEPGSPLAAARQARRGLRSPRADLRVVQRGLRHGGPPRGQGAAGSAVVRRAGCRGLVGHGSTLSGSIAPLTPLAWRARAASGQAT